MKFTCLQENLLKGLSIVYKAVPIKSSVPVTSNILIATENGRIKLAATNLDTSIITYIGASVEEEGAISVPAKLFRDYISNLPADTISFSLNESTLTVISNKTKSKFNGTPATEFPELPELAKDAVVIEIDPQLFSLAVTSVSFSSGIDESRPILTGIYINYNKGILTCASSDGFRLSEKKVKTKTIAETEFSVIIPAKTLIEAARIFASSEECIRLALNKEDNRLLLQSGDILLATSIFDGTYPDYKRIIPVSSNLTVEVLVQDFYNAVKLTSVFIKNLQDPIKLAINTDGKVDISSIAREVGEHQSQIEAVVNGEVINLEFNSKYLLDYLSNIKHEKIAIKASGTLAPCLFEPIGAEDYIHIIMPMQPSV